MNYTIEAKAGKEYDVVVCGAGTAGVIAAIAAGRQGAKTLLVTRKAVENAEQSNHADQNVFDHEYDCVVHNNGTLDELKDVAKDFLSFLFIK